MDASWLYLQNIILNYTYTGNMYDANDPSLVEMLNDDDMNLMNSVLDGIVD